MATVNRNLYLGVRLSSELAFVFALAGLYTFQSCSQAQTKPSSEILVGSHPGGDVVHWSDGTVWKQVTVMAVQVKDLGQGQQVRLEITNVPSGFKTGLFTNFVSVAMRSEEDVIRPIKEAISVTKLYTQGYAPRPAANLPSVKADFSDMYLCPWQPAWDAQGVDSEDILKTRNPKDGKPKLMQVNVVITHLAVEQGKLYCLVRRSKTNKTSIEGWYTDIEVVVFDWVWPRL